MRKIRLSSLRGKDQSFCFLGAESKYAGKNRQAVSFLYSWYQDLIKEKSCFDFVAAEERLSLKQPSLTQPE